MNPYQIFLADSHEVFRQGIKNIVCQANDIRITAETDNGHDLLELIEKAKPDLIIMEIDLPKLNGLTVLRKVKEKYPQVKVLIMTTSKYKDHIVNAMNKGVDGFILKEEPGSELTRAIQSIRSNKKFFSNLLVCDLLASYAKERMGEDFLSAREKEILRHLAEGSTNHEIADSLNISINTLYRHRQNIKRKLQVRNMAEVIKYAMSRKNDL